MIILYWVKHPIGHLEKILIGTTVSGKNSK